MTQNCDDFEAIHRANSEHPGILAVYQNNDRSKNMSRKELVKAIANLETAGIARFQSIYRSQSLTELIEAHKKHWVTEIERSRSGDVGWSMAKS